MSNIPNTSELQLNNYPASDVIFEWNIKSKSFSYYSAQISRYMYQDTWLPITQIGKASPNIHPDDNQIVWNLISDIHNGKTDITHEFRLREQNGDYIWCRCRIIIRMNEEGNADKAIGIITDIDKIHKELEKLRRRAELDALTGLYNKNETQVQIEEYLESTQSDNISALLIIDVDNFKTVNDTHGHLYGDATLADIAATIKKQMRLTDVVGRVGGDEFAVFMKNIPTEDFALHKSGQILQELELLFAEKIQGKPISCSIGISLFPRQGKNFTSLFQKADTALYQAKNAGKKRAMVYSESTSGFKKEDNSTTPVKVNPYINNHSENLMDYVFQTLFHTSDISGTMHALLQIIGKRFDANRIYIIENTADGANGSCTYEWCSNKTDSKKEQLQYITFNADISHHFKENQGIFFCKNVSLLPKEQQEQYQLQSVRSFLQCAIHENGILRGIVGFEECAGLHLWSQEEISALSLLSKILFVFLLKNRNPKI